MADPSLETPPPPCKICGGTTRFFDRCDFHANIKMHYGLYDMPVNPAGLMLDYYRCSSCGFLFTPFMDTWTAAQFAHFVYNNDYGRLDGAYNGGRAGSITNILYLAFRDCLANLEVLDYGGGIGVQSALLSAFGAKRAVSYDPFAAGSKRPEGKFNIVTCLEVLEHSTDPKAVVADLASFVETGSGFIFTTTELQPPDIETQKTGWWYMAPRVGHISFYTAGALERLFAPHGLRCTHIGTHSHVFYKEWPIWADTFMPGGGTTPPAKSC